jgi:CoA-transferase family III
MVHRERPAGRPIPSGAAPEGAGLLDSVVDEIHRWSGVLGTPVTVDWRDELTLRSRLLGLEPNARISAGMACRLLRASDAWVAITVARPWDHQALPALVESPVGEDPGATLTRWIATRTGAEAVARARLLDLAATIHDCIPTGTPVPLRATSAWPQRRQRPLDRLRVIDLSSLWAGPLVARVLRDAGATVIKVESLARPDGARAVPNLYEQLHTADQANVVVDLTSTGGQGDLRDLVEGADVVIEASRPRALEQLGAGPYQVGSRPGRVWLSLTGYGREKPGADWIAFGDDAAVAGGLTGTDEEGDPVFCGDATADPVTGLMGAAAVLRSLASGGGHLIDLALAGAAAAVVHNADLFGPEWS